MNVGEFLRVRTRPFSLPQEAVAVLRYFTIQRLVEQDGFETLDEWYDAMINEPAPRKSPLKRLLIRSYKVVRRIERFLQRRISE